MPLPWSHRCTARSCAAGCNGRATPSRSQSLIARSYCKVRDSTSSARVPPNPFPMAPFSPHGPCSPPLHPHAQRSGRFTDSKLVQSPALAGRVIAELLNRKCSLTASLSMATAHDMQRLNLVRLDRPTAYESEDVTLQRKRHLRQVKFAERMAQYVPAVRRRGRGSRGFLRDLTTCGPCWAFLAGPWPKRSSCTGASSRGICSRTRTAKGSGPPWKCCGR